MLRNIATRPPLAVLALTALLLSFAAPAAPQAAAQSAHSRTPSADGASLLSDPLGLDSPASYLMALAADSANQFIYVGGSFSAVNDAATTQTTANLARLNLDGTVDTTFTVQTGDDVRAFLITADYVYVGGDFSDGGSEDISDSAGTARADQIMRLNRATGLIDRSWLPSGQSNVYTIARMTGSVNRIVVGMSGSGYLRAINEADASDVVTFSNFDSTITSLIADGSTLYVGGRGFGTGGLPDYLRRYTYDGSSTFTYDTVWQPVANNPGIFDDEVTAMVLHGDFLYTGGEFNSGPADVDHLVRFPLANADGSGAEGWTHGIYDDDVETLAVHNDYLYVGGLFADLSASLVRYDLQQDPPALDRSWLPSVAVSRPNDLPIDVDDSTAVYGLAVLDDRVIVGGRFASINGAETGAGLAAVDSAPLDIPPAPSIRDSVAGSGRGPYTLTGSARAGNEVLVYSGSALLGTVIADGSGNWSFTTGATLAAGSHRFSARARPVYQFGTVMRSFSAPSNVVQVTIAPSDSPNPAGFAQALTGSGSCEIAGCSGGALELKGSGEGDLLNPFDVANTPLSPQNHVVFTTTGALPVNSAALLVRANDVDWAINETDYVYLNGHQLGTLTGLNNIWSTTVFPIPDLSWVEDGPNVLQFRLTTAGEHFNDNWTVRMSAVVLLIDGGLSEDADLDTFTVPEPSGTALSPQTTFTPRADGSFRVFTGLYDADNNMIASDLFETTGTNGTPIEVTAALTLPTTSAAGYTVRTELLYLDPAVGTYVLQRAADYTFTALSLTAENGTIGSPITLRAVVNPASNKGDPVSGAVEFYDGAALLGTAPVGGDGSAVFTFTPTAANHAFRARFPGNSRFSPSEARAGRAEFDSPVCTTVPDLAVSPAEIPLAPGDTAQLTISIRNLCTIAAWSNADLLLSLSDGLTVIAVPDGWLNLTQRAALQGLHLNPAETRSWTITVGAAAELPTSPIFVVEHYFLGSAGQRIDGVFLPPATVVAAPVEAAPVTPVEAAPAPAAPPALPVTLPNTAGPVLPLLALALSAVAALVAGRRLTAR
jgi:hypothetical protein